MRCGRCGKPLKREESIRLGIGPVCRRKLKNKKEFRCHHGFSCLPSIEYHVPTLLARARQRFETYKIEWDHSLETIITDELGIKRPRIKIRIEEDIRTLRQICKEKKICPFGLDCRDPEKALDAVYALIAKAIEHMETEDPELPLCDAIDPLLDLLGVMGFTNEAQYYQKLEEKLRKTARKKAALVFADRFLSEIFEGG